MQKNPSPEHHNTYQPGDLVFFHRKLKDNTFTALRKGPYEVATQINNRVAVTSLVYDKSHTFYVDRLSLFCGTKTAATEMAMLDDRQFMVEKIVAYKGNPTDRGTCSFLVQYEDGDLLWQAWSRDLHISAGGLLQTPRRAVRPPLQHSSPSNSTTNGRQQE